MQKIVIASTLKPVDDVRLFEKIAQSMAKTNKYEINIIGNSGKKESNFPNIHFHSFHLQRGQLLNRWTIRWKILRQIALLKPEVLIISTHELLSIGVLYRLVSRCKLMYDVQENYYRNWLFRDDGFRILKVIIGILIRLKEFFLSPLVHHYTLAEKPYAKELTFISKSKWTVLENKAVEMEAVERMKVKNQFIFSGTISTYSEVELAVDFYQKLSSNLNSSTLKIIGQIHDERLEKRLQKLAESDATISLILSKNPIPHASILEAIKRSEYGLVSYQPNRINQLKTPTKVFEYTRHNLIYFTQRGSNWTNRFANLDCTIPVDFYHFDKDEIIRKVEKISSQNVSAYPIEESWEYESKSLIEVIDKFN